MALTAKKSVNAIVSSQRDYEDPPPFPESLSRSEIQAWKVADSAWWAKTKTNIMALEDAVAALQQKVNSS